MNLIPGILRVTVISNTCKVISNHHHAFDVISVDLVPKRYQIFNDDEHSVTPAQ